MTIDQAAKLIKNCAGQMNARYEKVVFDEWAIISMTDGKVQLLAYDGPRKQGFLKNFQADASALRSGLLKKNHHVGDFEFARCAVGTSFEAYMVLGPRVFLICNHTVQCMDEITKDTLWLGAQEPFVELGDAFRIDPLFI